MELPSVDSTNSFLASLLDTFPVEGTTVFSATQTSGRGQQGNHWHSDPGMNIACSVLLLPRFIPVSRMFTLNKAVAVAIRDAIQAFLPEKEVLIKWPNDILIARKKVCGILIENQLSGSLFQSAIVGFGINLNQVDFDERHGRATSMALEAGKPLVLKKILEAVLEQLDRRYLALRSNRHEQVERDYLAHLHAYQEMTELQIDGVNKPAMPIGVDAHGRLAVQIDGSLRYFGVKEISFVL